jgi:hypothetical protein
MSEKQPDIEQILEALPLSPLRRTDPGGQPAGVRRPAAGDPVASDQTHLAGPDGEAIAELLAGPKAFAMSAIVEASMAATERARAARRVDPRFWNQADLGNVAASLAGLMGYSDLVGRARIRLYQLAARGATRAFASPKDLVKLAPDWSILAPLRGIGRAILEDLKALANFFADIFLGTDFIPPAGRSFTATWDFGGPSTRKRSSAKKSSRRSPTCRPRRNRRPPRTS